MVITFRDSKYAPKLATPQPTSRATLMFCPNLISGTVYKTMTYKHQNHKRRHTYTVHKSKTKAYNILFNNLGNMIQVLIRSMYKLCTTPRKPKLILAFGNPVLTPFIFNKTSVRNIAVPNLQEKTHNITLRNHCKSTLSKKKDK